MSLRKIAGLLVVSGLVLGLIGGGVGASFLDTVTATEEIRVADFECLIVDATAGAVIAGDQKSVSYTAPIINSSVAGSAPYFFDVRNTGEINAVLTVSTSSVSAPFSIVGFPFASVPLAPNATHRYNTGVQWTELGQANAGTSGTVTWTVSCGEVPATQTITSSVLNFGSTGWAGWSCPAGSTIVSASVDTAPIKGGVVLPITSITNWEPGASVAGVNYPNTPFGYTYTPPEEGAIVQNGGTGQSLYIVLVCQP